MGYYVDIFFDKERANDFSTILSIVKNAYPDCEIFDERESEVSLIIDGIHGSVSLLKKESEKKPGRWGYIRLSWASNSDVIEKLVVFAEKTGCRIYDESQGTYIDRINSEKIKNKFSHSAESLKNLLGVCKTKLSSE